MAEYIEREATCKGCVRYGMGETLCADCVVKVAPAADVAPIVRAAWKPYLDHFSKRHIGWICQNCSGVQMDLNRDTDYCPNCGALMEDE